MQYISDERTSIILQIYKNRDCVYVCHVCVCEYVDVCLCDRMQVEHDDRGIWASVERRRRARTRPSDGSRNFGICNKHGTTNSRDSQQYYVYLKLNNSVLCYIYTYGLKIYVQSYIYISSYIVYFRSGLSSDLGLNICMLVFIVASPTKTICIVIYQRLLRQPELAYHLWIHRAVCGN